MTRTTSRSVGSCARVAGFSTPARRPAQGVRDRRARTDRLPPRDRPDEIAEVVELHNGGLRWTRDRTMRGGLDDPEETSAHESFYSSLVDGAALDSSAACGACHDVVSPAGVVVERTYGEWSESVFSRDGVGLSCAGCHMAGRDAPNAARPTSRRRERNRRGRAAQPAREWRGHSYGFTRGSRRARRPSERRRASTGSRSPHPDGRAREGDARPHLP